MKKVMKKATVKAAPMKKAESKAAKTGASKLTEENLKALDAKIEAWKKKGDPNAKLDLTPDEKHKLHSRFQWALKSSDSAKALYKAADEAGAGQKQAAKLTVMKAWLWDKSFGQKFLSIARTISKKDTHKQFDRPQTKKQLLLKYDEHEIDHLLEVGALREVPHSKNSKMVVYIDTGFLVLISFFCNLVMVLFDCLVLTFCLNQYFANLHHLMLR